MRTPSKFLGWDLQKDLEGEIYISRTGLIQKLVEKAGLADTGTRICPLPKKLNFGKVSEAPILDTKSKGK